MTSLTRQIQCVKKDTGTLAYTLSLGARPFGIMLYGPQYQPVIDCKYQCLEEKKILQIYPNNQISIFFSMIDLQLNLVSIVQVMRMFLSIIEKKKHN